jgi:Na+-driven multidrug efflux pump
MEPDVARLTLKLSLLFIYVIEAVVIIAALIWREEVAELVSSLVPILCIETITDVPIAISSGVFYGLERQTYMLYINSVAYLLIAFPLAYCLVFKANDVGLAGLWYSNCVSGALCPGTCLAVSCSCFFWWTGKKKRKMLSEGF